MSVSYSLAVTCWERSDLLALLYVMFSCVFATFPYSGLGQVWYLIVSIPGLCLLSNLYVQEDFLWINITSFIATNTETSVVYFSK